MNDININILKLLQSNKDGVTKEDLIEYLDYVNKIRYTNDEINGHLTQLLKLKMVKNIGEIWYIDN
jgi:hypothetical protein